MTRLSVNVNKVATLRNTRPLDIPNLVHIARLALEAGADGITIHPRPDQRHIRDGDVADIANLLKDWPTREFNIEGNPFHGRYLNHCRTHRPTQCTLVPDSMDQLTSNHGWDLASESGRLKPIVTELKSLGCRVSLFMDPRPETMANAAKLGVDRVELYTEPYAQAFEQKHQSPAGDYTATAIAAQSANLKINAGHDLNLHNLDPFLKAVPNVEEVSIGHALIADALEQGIAQAVKAYKKICNQ